MLNDLLLFYPEKFREIYNFAFGWAKEKVSFLFNSRNYDFLIVIYHLGLELLSTLSEMLQQNAASYIDFLVVIFFWVFITQKPQWNLSIVKTAILTPKELSHVS